LIRQIQCIRPVGSDYFRFVRFCFSVYFEFDGSVFLIRQIHLSFDSVWRFDLVWVEFDWRTGVLERWRVVLEQRLFASGLREWST